MKKRILSFLLALLMAVSIMPMPTYAEGSTEATVTPTETPTEEATETDTETACPTCGIVGCTSKHLTWCAECKKDDCGKTHVFCEICQKNDCGQNHCPTCSTIDCTIDHDAPAPTAQPTEAPTEPVQPASDEEAPDYSGDIGRYVKLNTAVQSFKVYGLTPSTGTLDTQTFMHEDFQAGTILRITNWMMMNKTVWYQVTFYKGGTQGSFVGDFPAEPWFRQTEAGELVFLSTCGICSKPDCAGHTWCETCEDYDCGIDHSQPENPCNCGCESCTGAEGCECKCGNCDFCEKEEEPSQPSEPENTCDCGCESCTGAEGCECKCGNCDFCEKEEEPTEPELVDGPIYGSVNGQTITVNGKLPEGAKLVVSEADTPIFDFDREVSVYSYDISIRSGDDKVQPGAPVKVTFDNVKLYSGGVVYVYHVLEDVAAIQAGIHAGTAVETSEAAFVQNNPKALAAASAATGKTGVVYIETFASDEETVLLGSNSVSITVDSFSTFYLLSGNVNADSTLTELVNVSDGSPDTIYVVPGTTITFKRTKDAVFDTEMVANYAQWKVSSKPSNVTVTNGNGQTVGTGWCDADLWSNKDAYCTVAVGKNASTGVSFTLYSARGLGQGNQVAITIHIVSPNSLINDYIMPSGNYPVVIACLSDSRSIPGEPGVTSGKTWRYFDANYAVYNNTYQTFATRGQGIIDGSIASNPSFTSSADNTNTMGIVDATGAKTKAVVPGVNWDTALQKLAASGFATYASDGTQITSSNYQNYEMLPYVVKLQTSFSLGWHIDCMIVPKDTATLSYSLNLPGGSTVAGIALPASVNKPIPFNVTVAAPTVNGSNLAVGSKVTTTDNREFTFHGWYRNSSGTGDPVAIGSNLSISQNTVLYGKWSGGGYTAGTLIVGKLVTTAANSESPNAEQLFSFKVNGLTGSYSYTVYDASTLAQAGTGTITNGTFTIKANQAIYIPNVPNGTYAVEETNIPDHYSVDSASKSVTVSGGVENTVTFTNTYNKLRTCTMTAEFATPAHGEKIVPSDSVTVNYGEEAYTEFHVKDGYTITGRRVNGVEDSLSGTIVGHSVQSMTGDVHIIAYTAPIEYSITFDLNEGSWPTGTTVPEKYTIESAEITLPTPTRGGYKFMGWATTDGATSGDQTKIESGSTGEKTYYATWEKLGHKVTYQYSTIAPDGAPELPEEAWYAVGDTVTLKELPIIFGDYKITTWYAYDAQSKSVRIEDGKFTMPDSDVVIRGSWYTSMTGRFVGSNGSIMGTFTNELASSTSENQFNIGPMLGVHGGKKVTATAADNYIIVDVTVNGVQDPNFTEKEYVYTVPEGGPYEKIDIEVHVKEKPDLTVSLSGSGSDQNFVFEVTRSDGVAFDPIDVVLCSENNFRVTIKNLPVGEYTVTEKNDWSWRENDVNSQTVDLSTTSQTVHFDFGDVDNLHWLSGYSYNRKKGGS